MAGYMKKLQGYVYDGAHTAGAAMENGVFVEITTDGVKPVAAAKTGMVLRVAEKTTLWGRNAFVLDVVNHGDDEVFFLENEWDINDAEAYDTAKYTCKVGDYVRMHRCLDGEQLIMTVDDTVYAALAVGDKANIAANGTIAKKAASGGSGS